MAGHAITRPDPDFGSSPAPASPTASGLSRQVVVGPAIGAVHTELAIGALAPGGWLRRHVHSFEEALYLMAGELAIELDGRVHRLGAGDFTLMPIGVPHGLVNAGPGEARWISVNTPQRLAPGAGRQDTFFDEDPFDPAEVMSRATRPPFGDPRLRWVGHYDGTPPQLEHLRIKDEAHGRAPAGMDTALLAYSGISVKMLVDRGFGADLLTMFTVDYEPGGAAQPHDHPFEEAYVFLDGEIDAEIDGQSYRLRAGDVVFAGVGTVHGFYNVGTERVRWIETQAPQPPPRHAYRWVASWEGLEEGKADV
jgi:quercetin dioxygenase-like cupin family protein